MANQLPSFELEEKYKKYGLVVGVDEVVEDLGQDL